MIRELSMLWLQSGEELWDMQAGLAEVSPGELGAHLKSGSGCRRYVTSTTSQVHGSCRSKARGQADRGMAGPVPLLLGQVCQAAALHPEGRGPESRQGPFHTFRSLRQPCKGVQI